MIVYTDPQGTDAWLDARRGVITASRFAECRERLENGSPSKSALAYAMDTARERVGGKAPAKFVNAAMRTGTTEEPVARMRREMETGVLIEEAGLITTDDRKFGGSVDGLIGTDGVWECKTMVSSDTLFTAMVSGDVSAYADQCMGNLWLLGRKWCDLSLWCPDLDILHTIRLQRDENAIQALEDDLIAFERLVSQYEAQLRAKLGTPAPAPSPTPATPKAPVALPENIF